MRIGVTGTRDGCTTEQMQQLSLAFVYLECSELHHGDCIGVDCQAANMADEYEIKTICHPPSNNALRAYHKSLEYCIAKDYFARNRDIVNACDILLVVPKEMKHQTKGGTWYTHDYAVKSKKKVIVIFPDGTVTRINFEE